MAPPTLSPWERPGCGDCHSERSEESHRPYKPVNAHLCTHKRLFIARPSHPLSHNHHSRYNAPHHTHEPCNQKRDRCHFCFRRPVCMQSSQSVREVDMVKRQKFHIYLAGPISGCSNVDQIHQWRNDVKNSQYSKDFVFIDPAELPFLRPDATATPSR